MYNRVISFLYKLDFFYKHQYGFRKNYSTCHATSVLAESITDVLEKKKHVLGIFLDLSKVFHTIDHIILLDKLYDLYDLNLELLTKITSRRQSFKISFPRTLQNAKNKF